jgi:myosin heavy subunit
MRVVTSRPDCSNRSTSRAAKLTESSARGVQAEKDVRQMREENAVLSEEYSRLEEELANAAVHKHKHVAHVAEGKSAEIASLGDEIDELHSQVADLRKNSERLVKLESERDRLLDELDGRDRQLEQCVCPCTSPPSPTISQQRAICEFDAPVCKARTHCTVVSHSPDCVHATSMPF